MPKASAALTVSAIVYFLAGLALLFAPDELLGAVGRGGGFEALLLQLLAGAVYGFAILNWMSRHSTIGGIYGRPLVVANLAHTMIAALVVAHAALHTRASWPLLTALAVYALLAVSFAVVMVRSPKSVGAAG